MNRRLAKDLILIIAGSFLFAISINFFAIPNRLAEGGVTGLSMITFYLYKWSPGIVNFIINTALLIIGYKLLPKRMIFYSIVTIFLTSLFLFITEGMGKSYGDPLVGAIFAGVIIGIGMGLIFRAGSSSGGTAIIARMLNKSFGWELSNSMFILDALVVIGGYFVIGPLHTMYTLVDLFVGKKVIDFVMEGIDTKKAVTIVSDHASDIAKAINEEMKKSATVFIGYGSYTKESREVVYCIIRRQELFRLKQVVHQIDDHPFVIIHDVRDVFGGSFAWLENQKKKTNLPIKRKT
ncbi:uncharacterized membrane-anchored protein YitT (DUF2179 family) [Scopulibacillus darangshiensis]|uniref:Uncharacterized membrane-anchored protein YitT (DUF2179 family) n=1 Tax=Scopulibacillus darangshiensis TaxID=442528 RepID=A0A4V2SMY1_9BACL|nr:YitT family protein [Scopulibacillus darangshiensis]TCP29016.1 uncharacterized membrane-anchored protein YitT (DUF2179 family) [Scopulibacillus darangshiensis]